MLKSTTRAFVASGGMSMEAAHFRVMEHLARAGLFRKGLVLVGSHAFTALGIAATPLRYMDYLLGGDNRRGLVALGLEDEVYAALSALPAAGYPTALALVRQSQQRVEHSADWLGRQLDRLSA